MRVKDEVVNQERPRFICFSGLRSLSLQASPLACPEIRLIYYILWTVPHILAPGGTNPPKKMVIEGHGRI